MSTVVQTPPTDSPTRIVADRLSAGRQAVGRLLSGVRTGPLRAVTGLGWLALAIAVVAWPLSRWTGWSELGLLSVGLLAGFLVACLFVIGRSRYSVRVDLTSNRVVVGSPAVGTLFVAHGGGGRLLPIRMELPVGTDTASVSIPAMKAGDEHEQPFLLSTERRAVIPVGPARSVRGDGVGLVRRVVTWTEPEFLYVHPKTVSLFGSAPGHIRDLEGRTTRSLTNSDVSFHALREYVPGDDRRYVHWKTSARTWMQNQKLMVRQFEETRRSHLVVVIANQQTDHADEDEFEIAVSVGASLAVHSFREQRQLTAFEGQRRLRAGTARQFLDDVTAAALTPEGPTVTAAARYAATSVPEASMAVVICGSAPAPQDLQAALAAFPIDVRVVGIRVKPGAALSVRRISNLPFITLGDLTDLPRALRSVEL